MSRVRVGLIGASGFARANHCESLRRFDDVEMAAVAEPLPERREDFARELGIPRQYATHTDMLEKESLDAVYAVMAPHRSYDVLHHCISLGLPIFIEKPAVLNSYQGFRLAEVEAKSGARTMVAFNRRLMPSLREGLNRARTGGDITHLAVRYYKHMPQAYYYNGAIDFLRSDGIHAVDALRWIGGEPVHVTSSVRAHHAEVFNTVNAIVTFGSGATGVLLLNFAAAQRVHTFELHSLNCSVFVDPDSVVKVLRAEPNEDITLVSAEIAGGEDRRANYGFEAENRHFIDCVKSGRKPECGIEEAAKSHALVEDILRSAT